MSNGRANSDSFDDAAAADWDARVVNELVAYDEQVRLGQASTLHESQDTASCPTELLECLQLVERIWPRRSTPATAPELPGEIGRFRILRLLGAGGFGIVYLANDPLLDRQVALKVPRLHTLANERLLKRFRREALAAATLDHPCIVPIHETGVDGPISYLVSAYCAGPNLAQWFKEQTQRVPPRVAAEIVRQLAAAMHFSHQRGVLHRDLKPSNILLFPLPAGARDEAFPFTPRITDFGLARLVEEEVEATGSSAVIGTPMYMAPEQALGATHEVTARADIYSLGAMLYELLCGQPPFTGASPLDVLDRVRHGEPLAPRRIRSEIPLDLETICLRCLQKRPGDRYALAQDLADDLQRFLSGVEITARPVTWRERALAWCRQPQRFRDAGLAIIATNLLIMGQLALGVLMAHLGYIPHPKSDGPLSAFAGATCISLTLHLPLVFVGLAVIAQRRWAIVVAFWMGLLMAVTNLILAGAMPLGANLWDDIPGFRVLYSLIWMLCFFQAFASAVAWLTWREQRR